MRGVFFALATFTLIALVAVIHDFNRKDSFPPFVTVAVQDDITAKNVDFSPGLSAGGGVSYGGWASFEFKPTWCRVDESSMIASSSGDQPTSVLAHFVIHRDGVIRKVDLPLQVWDKKPDSTSWIKLDDHLQAVAYLNGPAIIQ
jgi:hypothetical protein